MNYWLDLFTGTTWDEYRKAGAKVTGFRARMHATGKKVKPGDIFLCYLTGVKRWVGALEVIGPSNDQSRIWQHDDFPVRFEVKPLIMLDPEHGVPMDELIGRLTFFAGPEDRGGYKGFLRMSPNLFKSPADGALVLDLLRQAEKNPIARPVDAKQLSRKPLYKVEARQGKGKSEATVSIPEAEEAAPVAEAIEQGQQTPPAKEYTTRHTEIQHLLLRLGADMGFNTWVAKNDRSKTWNGVSLGDMPNMLSELPTQFNEATNRTIELIDVLWLKGNSIVSAFEIECTTSVYSGLLRMSDLLALQPNLDIRLFLVAPDERSDKVELEIRRPTFTLREKPLTRICGFLSFSNLTQKVDGVYKMGIVRSLKSDFIETIAEYFDDEMALA